MTACRRSPSPRCSPRSPTTSRPTSRRVDRAGARGRRARARRSILPPRAVRGPLLLPHAARGRLRARAPAPRATRRCATSSALAAELGVGDPGVVLRAARAPSTTTASSCSTPTAATSGVYRKSHIPDGPGYQEKFFFKPGDTGFTTFATQYGTIGVAICWDQWFPEAARAMALRRRRRAALPDRDRQRAGGARARQPRLVAARDDRPRGRQRGRRGRGQPRRDGGRGAGAITFYGSSFVADARGDKRRRARPRRARASRSPRSTSRSSGRSARAWGCSATAGPSCIARWWSRGVDGHVQGGVDVHVRVEVAAFCGRGATVRRRHPSGSAWCPCGRNCLLKPDRARGCLTRDDPPPRARRARRRDRGR